MFRRRYQATNGALPTTSGNVSAPSVFSLGSNKAADGSAKSIQLQSPVVTKWKRSSKAVKISYTVGLLLLFIAIMGWRIITYHSAKIYIECTTTDCSFAVRGAGRQPAVKLIIPRRQILGSKAVKVNKEGKVVNENVNVNDEWKFAKTKKKKDQNSNSYKGPDKDGNYLTYVIRLKDKDPSEVAADTAKNTNSTEQAPHNSENLEEQPTVALAPIMPFIVSSEESDDLHIVMRQNGIQQNRRRVRNMIQKVDSYAKKRRHKLTVKESTPPDWRGVLMMVFGGCGFMVLMVLGMFWDEEEGQAASKGGPGARSQKKQHEKQPSNQPSNKSVNPYQRAMPSRYEVSTLMQRKARQIRSFEMIRLWHLLQQERATVNTIQGISAPESSSPSSYASSQHHSSSSFYNIHQINDFVLREDKQLPFELTLNSTKALLRTMTLPAPLVESITQFLPMPHLWPQRMGMLTKRSMVDSGATVISALDMIDEILEEAGFLEACDVAKVTGPLPAPFNCWKDWKRYVRLRCRVAPEQHHNVGVRTNQPPHPRRLDVTMATVPPPANPDQPTFVELRRQVGYLEVLAAANHHFIHQNQNQQYHHYQQQHPCHHHTTHHQQLHQSSNVNNTSSTNIGGPPAAAVATIAQQHHHHPNLVQVLSSPPYLLPPGLLKQLIVTSDLAVLTRRMMVVGSSQGTGSISSSSITYDSTVAMDLVMLSSRLCSWYWRGRQGF